MTLHLAMTLKYPQIQSQRISREDIAIPRPPSISMLSILIVLCITTYINDHLSIQATLRLVGLTTKELLPTALR